MYPHWFKRAPQVGDDPIGVLRWRVYNRTGGSTVAGNTYLFDLGLSTTATNEVSVADGALSAVTNTKWSGSDRGGGSDSAWRNIVTPATAYLRQGYYCMAESVAGDNEPLFVTVIGKVTLAASQTSSGVGDSTVTAGWQHFEPVNGASTLLYTTSATTTSRIVFVSTGSFVVASNVVTSTVAGYFNGFGF
jgi:hypothetical protein